MKKRILAMLLSALLVANLEACNQVPENENDLDNQTPSESVTDNVATPDNENGSDNNPENTNTPEEDDSQNNNQDNNDQTPPDRNISLKELREQTGCFVITKRENYLDYFQSKNQVFGEINYEEVENTPNTFHITTVKNNTEYKTTVSLSNDVNINAIHDGFISEEIGYIFIFSGPKMGRSVDSYHRLACLLKTNDGGKTWSKTEYQDLVITHNYKEDISDACFFTEQVGFFTAPYYTTEYFEGRTFWTTDGGKTWERMSLLPKPAMLAPFGLPGYNFATELSDVKYLNGTYLITVRICQGYSCKVDGASGMYIQYSSTDLKNWTLVT